MRAEKIYLPGFPMRQLPVQPIPLFIAPALCLDLYQEIKITVLTALIKPSLPPPEPYSYTNIILSRYKLQTPQKPP